MENQWHFKVMELLFKWMFNVVPLFLQAMSTKLKLMTVSYQWLYLTSEDLLDSVIELEPAIFIILSIPLQSAVGFFFSAESSMFKEGRLGFANDICLISHLTSVPESH